MRNTESNHFTVVIPTRERCDTLEHTLRTCVMQEYTNLEIIVSDNFSQDRTREVVEYFKDSRIRYINTGQRISMSENYEFALSHIKPKGYIIYIGDDDGLLPNAISDINRIIDQTGAEVIRWDIASYHWPEIDGETANVVNIPHYKSGITVKKSSETIQNVLSFNHGFGALPILYNRSAVKYDVISRIKSQSGRFYNSTTPDVYSGFVIAESSETYVNSERPYSISGRSQHSIGYALQNQKNDNLRKLLNEFNIPFHSSLIFGNSIELAVVESYLQARDHFHFSSEYVLDMGKLFSLMISKASEKSDEEYVSMTNTVLSIGRLNGIVHLAEKAVLLNPHKKPGERNKISLNMAFKKPLKAIRYAYEFIQNDKFNIELNGSQFGVKNSYDACLLCGTFNKLIDLKIIKKNVFMKSFILDIKNRVLVTLQKLS